MATCVVTKNGGSATVVLPVDWRKRNNVEVGDRLEVEMGVAGQITFSKNRDKRTQAYDDLLEFCRRAPVTPLIGDASVQSDKEVLAQRYE